MKKHFIFSVLLTTLLSFQIFSQSSFKVGSGAQLILGDAYLVIDSTHVILEGQLKAETSTVKFSGINDVNFVTGGHSFYKFILGKAVGSKIILQDSLGILDSFIFAAANNKVILGDHNIHFSAAAKVSGYNDGNYFMTGGLGQVRKANLNATPFTFPIGFDASTYNPVIITENGITDTIGVRCLEHALSQGQSGMPLTSGVVDACWEITEAVPGNMNIDLTVQWNASDELPGFDRNDTGNSNYVSGKWDLVAGHCKAANGTGPFTLQRNNITGTGAFATFDCASALLPIELLNFYVAKNGLSDALLNWQTTFESNTSHFEIERSNNGKDWQQIGTMPAAGNSSINLEYTFLDENINGGGSMNAELFYRLKMVDLDRNFDYSLVRSVLFSESAELIIYPNPTTWGIYIDSRKYEFEEEGFAVNIYSLDGRLVLEKIIGVNSEPIYFSESIVAGIYQVVVRRKNGASILNKRIVLIK